MLPVPTGGAVKGATSAQAGPPKALKRLYDTVGTICAFMMPWLGEYWLVRALDDWERDGSFQIVTRWAIAGFWEDSCQEDSKDWHHDEVELLESWLKLYLSSYTAETRRMPSQKWNCGHWGKHCGDGASGR